MDVIYRDGDLQILTIVTNDGMAAEANKSADEYLLELGPGHVRIPYQAALIRIAAVERYMFLERPWQEITEGEWFDAIVALPPKNWRVVDDVEIFQSADHLCNDITIHYARFGRRFFRAYRSVAQDYHDLEREIVALSL